MSVFNDIFEVVLKEKFGSGFTHEEWYAPNSDSVNYNVTYQGDTKQISLYGITDLLNSGTSVKALMRTQLDEQFG